MNTKQARKFIKQFGAERGITISDIRTVSRASIPHDTRDIVLTSFTEEVWDDPKNLDLSNKFDRVLTSADLDYLQKTTGAQDVEFMADGWNLRLAGLPLE